MSILYVSDPEAKIAFIENRVVANYADGMQQSFPVEGVESITLLTKVQISTKCMEQCLKRGIPVAFFSKDGHYFGRLVSTGHVNAALQRRQSMLYDTSFSLELSRRLIAAKIKNQLVVKKKARPVSMNPLPLDDEDMKYDYFFGDSDEKKRKNKIFALVIYDIGANKKRTQFAKLMNGYGTRVQKSCFEVIVSASAFDKMLKRIGGYCQDGDSIRVYRLQGKSHVYQWGKDNVIEEEEIVVL